MSSNLKMRGTWCISYARCKSPIRARNLRCGNPPRKAPHKSRPEESPAHQLVPVLTNSGTDENEWHEGAMFMRAKIISITVALALIPAAALLHARAGGGTISGKVTYEGTPAKPKPIDMSKEPSCAKQHTTPITTETVVTGPNNSLENVVVYISAGAPDDSAPSQPAK